MHNFVHAVIYTVCVYIIRQKRKSHDREIRLIGIRHLTLDREIFDSNYVDNMKLFCNLKVNAFLLLLQY